MNTAQIYSQITGRQERQDQREENSTLPGGEKTPEQKIAIKAEVDAAAFQAKHQWLQSSTTQNLVKDLSKQYEALIGEAQAAACNSITVKNPDLIIHKLVRANEVQQFLSKILTINK